MLKNLYIKFLYAPVSGGVGKATTGELMIMVGGVEDEIDYVRPLLNVMGQVQIAGPLGAGHAIKALNNYVSAAGLIASFEALATAKSFGISAENFLKILLKPISDECSFIIKNEKIFKEKFLNDRKKFDPKILRVISADISQMYCNINLVRCVSII